MRKSKIIALMVTIALMAAITLTLFLQRGVAAAYTGITPPTTGSPGYETMTFHLTGAVSASTASIIKFKIPWAARLLQVQATARAITGGAATLDLLEAGTTVLSSVMTMTTAGTTYDATISDANLAEDAVISMNLVVTTSITDTTIVLVMKRK